MGVAVALTVLLFSSAAPSAPASPASDASALTAVASSCAGATSAAGDTRSRLDAMYCGINVVRRTFGVGPVRVDVPLNRSSLLKAEAVRRCGFSHTPCGMSFSGTFARAGYLPARRFAENLAWGQGEVGSPVRTLAAWLRSPPHRANLLGRSWRDFGIAVESGQMFGRSGVCLWVLQFGRRR
jgi:uncharacterized protein YkwD